MKKIKRAVAALAVAVAMSLSALATAVPVYYNGELMPLEGVLIDGTTYLPLRSFFEYSGRAVKWDNQSRIARVTGGGLSLMTKEYSSIVECNGRYFYSDSRSQIINGGSFMIPARQAAKAVSGQAEWNNSARIVSITGTGSAESGDSYYSQSDLYWLSRIISSESRGEPLEGQIAVGNVVLNRVNSREFPNNIYGVIFDSNHGVQFTPVANGTVYNEPDPESVIAAKICLDGYETSGNPLYFFNPRTAQNQSWIVQNRTFLRSIGNHDFYA